MKKIISELRIEKEQAHDKIRRANMQVHEHSNFLEKNTQISSQKMQDLIDRLDYEKQKNYKLEKEGEELKVGLENMKKSLETYKEESGNKILVEKQKSTEMSFELEKVKQQAEKQISKLTKENLAKTHQISKMDADINFAKQESNLIIEAQAVLKSNFKEISDQNFTYKQALGENKKTFVRLDEQIKLIEENSSNELNNVYDSAEYLKDMIRSEMFQKEQEYLKLIEEIRKDYDKIIEKESLNREFDLESIRIEASRSKDHYSKLMSIKDEEIEVLNQDRKKLQEIIGELEDKINDLSSSLDQSIVERKRMSVELARQKENDFEFTNKSTLSNLRLQEENEILNQRMVEESGYFGQLLERRDDEIRQLKEKFEDRLKKRVVISQEKISNWKSRLRQEVDCLRQNPYQDSQAVNGFMDRVEKLVSSISF